jgi:hypothetical protein
MSQDLSDHHLSLLMFWEDTCCLSFESAALMPKRVRFSLVARLHHGCLEVMQSLNRARFVKGKARLTCLQQADIELANLKLVLRLSFKLKCLPNKKFEALSMAYHQAGAMLGGWIKSCQTSPQYR